MLLSLLSLKKIQDGRLYCHKSYCLTKHGTLKASDPKQSDLLRGLRSFFLFSSGFREQLHIGLLKTKFITVHHRVGITTATLTLNDANTTTTHNN